MIDIMVTRHRGLVEYAIEKGYISADTRVLTHVTPDDLRGKSVIGVLPLHLAAECAYIMEIPLALTPEDRGKDLPVERVREIAGPPRTYIVQRIG